MTLKKMARPALATRGPGEDHKHPQSYPRAAELQSLGEQFALRWIDAAERFTCSFFRALTDPPVTAIDDDLRLSPGDFPSSEFWNLVAILCGFSEHKVRPTIDAILRVAHDAGFDLPGGGGDPAAELRDVLERESSAAGLPSWARELQVCARKHRQVARLWSVLRGWIKNPLGDTRIDSGTIRTAAPPPTRRFSSRALATVRGGA